MKNSEVITDSRSYSNLSINKGNLKERGRLSWPVGKEQEVMVLD